MPHRMLKGGSVSKKTRKFLRSKFHLSLTIPVFHHGADRRRDKPVCVISRKVADEWWRQGAGEMVSGGKVFLLAKNVQMHPTDCVQTDSFGPEVIEAYADRRVWARARVDAFRPSLSLA